MKRLALALLILWLASLACSLYSEPTAGTAAEPLPTKPIPHPSPTITPIITATATAAPVFCTVTAFEALNLRGGPGMEYSVIYWLRAGDVLTILRPGTWAHVRTATGYTGYINSSYCEVTK